MIFPLLLFIFSFLVFIGGVSPSVYGGDSGDIILASWFGGVAHPPGYPLNTMIGWVFTHLPYSATVAFKANLMAAFLQAITVTVLFLILKKLTKNIYASTAGSLALAFTPLFWLYAHIIEVFQLNLVLIGLSVYFTILWRESFLAKKQKIKFLYTAFLFWGLAVFHHQTSILLAPAFIYLVLKTNRKILREKFLIIKLALFFFLGFIPYIFIPFAALRQTPINWDNPVNLQNFIRLISRADYGTFTPADFIIGSNLKTKLFQLINYFLFLRADFSTIGLILIMLGAIYSFLRLRAIFWFLLLAIFFSGPFFLFYASFPLNNDFYKGLWERFILTSYFFLVIFIGLGFKFIYDLATLFFRKRIKILLLSKQALMLLIGLSLFIYPLSFIFINFPKTNLRNFYLGNWLGHDVLASAEPNSIVFLLGDTLTFNTEYIYYTDSSFRNIKIIRAGILYRKEYREQIIKEYKDLVIPDIFFSDKEENGTEYVKTLINSNISQFPIYSVDYLPKTDKYKWTTRGLLKRLIPNERYDKEELIRLNEEIFSNLKFNDFAFNFGYSQFITDHNKEIYYLSLIEFSDELVADGLESDAVKYLNKAIVLQPDRKEAYIRSANIYFDRKECEQSKEYFQKVINLDKKDWKALEALSKVYGECYQDQETSRDFLEKAEILRKKISDKPLESF